MLVRYNNTQLCIDIYIFTLISFKKEPTSFAVRDKGVFSLYLSHGCHPPKNIF